MEETACYSLNVASYPDVDSLYLCELLDADKYQATESDLQEDGDFHHFSPLVSLKLTLTNTYLALTVQLLSKLFSDKLQKGDWNTAHYGIIK